MTILQRTNAHHVDVLTQVRDDQTRHFLERHQRYVWVLKKELAELKREMGDVKAEHFLGRGEMKREMEDLEREVADLKRR